MSATKFFLWIRRDNVAGYDKSRCTSPLLEPGLSLPGIFFLVFPQLVDRLLSFKLVSAASTRASISSLILFRMAVEPPQPKNVYLNSY
jgi:hypothetical protein